MSIAMTSGLSATSNISNMQTYLNNTTAKDRNPWNGAAGAFGALASGGGNASSAGAFASTIAGQAGSLGQVMFFIQQPTSTLPGFMGGVVKLQASSTSDTASHVRTKVSGIE